MYLPLDDPALACFDHYPFMTVPAPVTAPAPPATVPPIVAPFVVPTPTPPALPNPTRFRTRLGVVYCTVCDLAVPYCKGHAPPDAQSTDGAESSLRARIAEVKGK